jgi:hypothetical protein
MLTPKVLKKHLFTVDDHTTTDSTFIINRLRLSGDHVFASYMLTPEAFDKVESVTLLTLILFDENGTTKKVIDFEVKYDRIESFECDWEDNSFIKFEVRFNVLGRKAH